MDYKEKDIAYEKGDYWVLRVKHGYEVYKKGITHSTRCGIIGYTGEWGLNRAIDECEKRRLADRSA